MTPTQTIAISSLVKVHGEMRGESVELTVSEHHDLNETTAYEALLGASARFARQDYVEEAWRIVDPVLAGATAVHEYEPGSWGPAEADAVAPDGGWFNPAMTNKGG